MTNQSRYSYTTSWAVGRRFRSDRRIAPMSRRCAGANLAISVRNSASADRRDASDWVFPGTSSSTWTERRPEASFFTLMMAPWDRISAAIGASAFVRSFALGRLRRHREEFIYPRLPQRLLAGGNAGSLIAIEIETDRRHDRAAAVGGANVGDARARLVEAEHDVVRILVGGLHDAAERWITGRGRPTVPGGDAF